MLPPNEVVKARNAVERLYDRLCTISENKPYQKENGTTGTRWEAVAENIPCRISFSQLTSADKGEKVTAITQVIKLLLSPEIVIKPGSRVKVVKDTWVDYFEAAGVPKVYDSHQEVMLVLSKRWA
ncbi:MAG: hypothetical protein Q4A29_03795 [Eubacteriales bacterium]|nr:hypothetical protein [Eubacteriales bacterium]